MNRGFFITAGLGLVMFGLKSLFPENEETGRIFVVAGVSLIVAAFTWQVIGERILFWIRGNTGINLLVNPSAYDLQIRFSDTMLLPDDETANPFLLRLQNIGKFSITHLKVKFQVIGLDINKILSGSLIFKNVSPNQDDGVWIVTKKNGSRSSIGVSYKTEGERYVDLIQAEDACELEMPAHVKSALSLFMIDASSNIFKYEIDNELTAAIKNGDLDRQTNILSTRMHESMIEMPDIELKMEWFEDGKKKKANFDLKSIYQPLGGSFWYEKTEDDKKVYILNGGMGTLSFENLKAPEKGFYNIWRNRKDSCLPDKISSNG